LTDAHTEQQLHVQLEPVFTSAGDNLQMVEGIFKVYEHLLNRIYETDAQACFVAQIGATQLRRFEVDVVEEMNTEYVHGAKVILNAMAMSVNLKTLVFVTLIYLPLQKQTARHFHWTLWMKRTISP
jgi:hypothetical protein